MKLYIAEKPSLGRAIAECLPKPHRKKNGYIEVGNGDCVTWCIGHLLEQAEPEAYDPQFKKWRLEHLPIIPSQWLLQPKDSTKKQLTVLKGLVHKADQLVHAGDPDREGQLLIDEAIQYLKVSSSKRDQMQRCLINDLTPAAVTRALGQLRDNKEFVPLSTSALARSRADWLYGINMTRAYTLQGQKVGYSGVLSVGRVQTPLLGLVVRRDLDIEAFKSKTFYEVVAKLNTLETEAQHFTAKWHPSKACEAFMDEENRILSKPLAENVIQRIKGQPGKVTSVIKKNKSQAPPLLYNLSTLQIEAARRFGMSAKQVLDSCQSLYEKHKLITYPRSDSRYLPEEHYTDRQRIINTIASNIEILSSPAEQTNSQLKSKVWNDKKVDAHHAIIPTEKRQQISRLNHHEAQLYEMIARQYLCQFYPKFEYADTKVDIEIAGGLFIAKSLVTQHLGWKKLFTTDEKNHGLETLPNLKKDQILHCPCGELLEKQTQPPKHFTDATLLAAMTGISRYVQDHEIRKILRETDGLGTEATRAGIIELLFRRSFLIRQGKQIYSTITGRGLIKSLPDSATSPDMTAHWESVLNAISQRKANYQGFMEPLIQTLDNLIQQSKANLPIHLRGIHTDNNITKPKKYNQKKSRKKKSKSLSST